MNHHRYYFGLRVAFSALALFIASGSALLRAQAPAQPPVVDENARRAEVLRLAASSKPKDRISAAETLASEDMDYDLFFKLMQDTDREVRTYTFFALMNFCADKGGAIPLEMARKLAALMEPEVTDERIQAAFADKDSKEETDDDITHLFACALALNSLYRHASLSPASDSYQGWQERVLKYIVICLTYDRASHGDEHEEYLYVLLQMITDPDALNQSLHWTLEDLDDLPSARQLAALEELWQHPLLGEGKPMNLILLQELGPVWQPVRDHILRNSKDRDADSQKESAALLRRIDAAFSEARKQLTLPPAKSAEK